MKDVLRSRLTLLLALLAIFAIAVAGPQPAAIAYCGGDTGSVRFYSDATYTTQVGYCWKNCIQCRWFCSGQTNTGYRIEDISACEDPFS